MKTLEAKRMENLQGGNCTGQAIGEVSALINLGKVASKDDSTSWDWAQASAGVTSASYAWFACMGWL